MCILQTVRVEKIGICLRCGLLFLRSLSFGVVDRLALAGYLVIVGLLWLVLLQTNTSCSMDNNI